MTLNPLHVFACPLEARIGEALVRAGLDFDREAPVGNGRTLDFYVPAWRVYIEVKRFHSPRILAQLAGDHDVIVAQGARAVDALAALIEGGAP